MLRNDSCECIHRLAKDCKCQAFKGELLEFERNSLKMFCCQEVYVSYLFIDPSEPGL